MIELNLVTLKKSETMHLNNVIAQVTWVDGNVREVTLTDGIATYVIRGNYGISLEVCQPAEQASPLPVANSALSERVLP